MQRVELDNEIKDTLLRWMSDPFGRKTLAWIIYGICGTLRTTFATNALVQALNEGRRQTGLELITVLQSIDPDNFIKMHTEFGYVGREPRKDDHK